ncbi:hypothetical protein [Paenibacillus macquariensis]|uniref:Uncharacterized protein n=1 Tax=Paenibacillus macquariensis TaxID=948756 RepID=A0ABY1K9A5_9BACL|nr:hypothetical protein [Paenibacillus macquariensis]MEC0091578.1 hypothetical protein [Paenibacillus macquariensis]OAB26704.1 hypothetical protein PMSM_26440 [Paenibacillus macquariensis subsp. macquariensis]SIR44981.1 hypothetical protein SAMN05421578_11490 [Paenibacillus macquariensis]
MFHMVTTFINTLSSSVEGFILAGLMVVLFIWLYIRTAIQLQTTGKEQLERLQKSLMLYSRVTGPLSEMMEREDHSLEEICQLIALLEECKAAPLLTSDLHEQIDAYIRERDPSRLSMLHKTWVREVNRRIEEQSTLLRKWDRPSWGFSFWGLLKPALPFMALVAILIWSLQLYQTLIGLPESHVIYAWARFVSCVIATASLYLVFMYTRRLPYNLVYTGLYVLIALVALFHLLGLNMALYIISVQVILFIAGFTFTTKRTRRERPYAGRDLVITVAPTLITEETVTSLATTPSQDISELPRRSRRMNNK